MVPGDPGRVTPRMKISFSVRLPLPVTEGLWSPVFAWRIESLHAIGLGCIYCAEWAREIATAEFAPLLTPFGDWIGCRLLFSVSLDAASSLVVARFAPAPHMTVKHLLRAP